MDPVEETGNPTIRSIGIVVNPTKPRANDVVREIADVCRAMGLTGMLAAPPDAGIEPAGMKVVAEEDLCCLCDMVIACGGDGTILRAARLMMGDPKPILGVNLGRLGFLAELAPEFVESGLKMIHEGRFFVKSRMTLEARVDGSDTVHHALNDIIIAKSNQSRIIALDMYESGRWVNTYVADGLILATPTGSTGYALAAGGPIITPRTNAVSIVPICPHSLTVRPMIFDGGVEIDIRASGTSDSTILLSADGQGSCTLESGQNVRVRRGKKDALLIRLESSSYYDILRQKLHWGLDKTLGGERGQNGEITGTTMP
jgi:NAD+ kinase